MRSSMHALVVCSLALVLQSCCLCDTDTTGRGRAKFGGQYPEPPFDIPPTHPGPGLVYGTADFGSSGTVLIKIQVEDLSTPTGNQATIKAWSGNGDAPTAAADPSTGTVLYDTGGDVPLRDWTTHIDRNYDSNPATHYWVLVKVDHLLANGQRDVWYMRYTWDPPTTSSPDSLHDFDKN